MALRSGHGWALGHRANMNSFSLPSPPPPEVYQSVYQDAPSFAYVFACLIISCVLLVKVVRLGRLERPTSCFGGTRSIQLSYSRVVPLYHAGLVARIPGINF